MKAFKLGLTLLLIALLLLGIKLLIDGCSGTHIVGPDISTTTSLEPATTTTAGSTTTTTTGAPTSSTAPPTTNTTATTSTTTTTIRGVTWTEVPQSVPFSGRVWHSVLYYGTKMWVIGGFVSGNVGTNEVNSSSDSASWNKHTVSDAVGKRNGHAGVIFDHNASGDKMWIIGGTLTLVGRKNEVMHSSDGDTWTKVTPITTLFSSREHHSDRKSVV
jgi:hypothetical protein